MGKNTLKNILLFQGGKCFYCDKKLELINATIEHIVPRAEGGKNTESNICACCGAMNQALGHCSAKKKIALLKKWKGKLPCPMDS